MAAFAFGIPLSFKLRSQMLSVCSIDSAGLHLVYLKNQSPGIAFTLSLITLIAVNSHKEEKQIILINLLWSGVARCFFLNMQVETL